MKRFIFLYVVTYLKTWKGGCFIYCVESNTESPAKWTNRNMFQMKEQKPQWNRVNNLPDKKFKGVIHKHAHPTGEKNGLTL